MPHPVATSTRLTTTFTSSLPALQQWTAHALITLVTLTLVVNAYNSGIAKTPLLVVCSSLILALFLSYSLLQNRLEVRRLFVDILVLALALLCTVSAFFSAYPAYNVSSLYIWIGYFVCFFAGAGLFTTIKDVRRLFTVITVVTIIVCIVGIAQFLLPDGLPLDFHVGADHRVGSTLGNPVFLSGFIVLVFPLLLGQNIAMRGRSLRRVLHLLLLASLLLLLLATQSRGSIAALVVSMLCFAMLRKESRFHIILWSVVAFAAGSLIAALAMPDLTRRIMEMFAFDPTSTFARRTFFWAAGLRAFLNAPVVGHGIGSFESVIPSYRSPDYWLVRSEDIVSHAHNELLEIAVETGVLGAALFAVILVVILLSGIRTSKQSRSWEHLTAAGLVCSMIAVISDNLVSVSLRQPPVGVLAWMFMGLLTSSLFRKTPSRSSTILLRAPKGLAIVPVLAWVVFVVFYGRQQIDEIRSDSHVLKGMMATLRQAPGLAVEQYRMAVEFHPQNLFAQFNLALECLKANRADESLQTSAMLQRASRDYPKSHLIRAASLLSLNRPAEALGSIQRELELRNHPEAYHLESLIYRKLADSAKEQASLENVLQSSIRGNFPYRFDYICDRLTTLGIAGKTCDHIRPMYEELIRRFPGEPVVRENLAAVYKCLGENEKAEELTSKARR